MLNRLPVYLFLLGIILLTFLITREIYKEDKPSVQEDATVLLEQVRNVMKLVTVEGDYNEVFSHKDTWTYNDLLSSLPGFEKRALIRVKARAHVGYDLERMSIRTDETTHTVYIDAAAEPQVLALEHDVDYFDLDEGLFNHFSEAELTAINAKAKRRIQEQVEKSGLFDAARKQRGEVMAAVKAMVESQGWKLVEGSPAIDGRTRLND